MRILLPSLAGLLGLAFGSFLNVCLSRWPSGESVVRPSSHCRACGRTLSWWENVPVVSWIALRGRCRTCKAVIGWRYPLVELAVGVGWALIAAQYMQTQNSDVSDFDFQYQVFACLGQMAFLWLLAALAVLDLENLWLPDKLTISGIAIGSLLQIAKGTRIAFSHVPHSASRASFLWHQLQPVLWQLLIGIGVSAALILFIRWTYWLVRRREGMGLGDAKLMAMLGAWLGLEGALLSFAIGVLLGALIGLLVLIRGGRGNLTQSTQTKMPLGTFLCIGGIISALWGQPIIAAYLHFIGL